MIALIPLRNVNMETIGKIRGVYAGKAVPYTRPGTFSAIDKQPVAGPVAVGTEGLQCDEQGDRRVHGGPDKAVHVYAWPNYAHWRAQFPDNRRFDAAPAFGENLSVEGVDETTVCLGDQWRVGTVLFEVSQGRQPCWKLNDRFGIADMARRVQDSLLAGWYLRVLEPGELQAGDPILLIARPNAAWSVARVLTVIRDRQCEPALMQELLELGLPASWQRLFARRLEAGQVEDWQSRLGEGS